MNDVDELREKLLRWHYNKCKTINIVDLLQSNYQRFRYIVGHRIGENIGFREAIKIANQNELYELQNIIDEDRLDIRMRKQNSKMKTKK